jgi:hypothetical protein
MHEQAHQSALSSVGYTFSIAHELRGAFGVRGIPALSFFGLQEANE